ncbi:MAG: hypothetical protein HOK52_08830 [Candidatus Marinimicrobia bacterium]|jgi:hypothetical protein|nr:hypothetical protein [Candidatus Neomarinimicrobiota bacterium]MBT3937403.1 hypothetical protein [Candidatus Neomarinimicrobiota bacterium]MBT3961001.1 hypothetical protein [Candidatus Neomarinimicrobiota bacterium]MBT4383938.1 hypothetical protein [Candidatus Neomarinimicrobiota bacterium]MBT4636153.1 hypothetical protein [Candidatus Neomarinimicrobiota bacterium]
MNLKHDSLNHEKNQLIGKRIIIEDVEWRISEVIERMVTLTLESPDGEFLIKKLNLAKVTHYLQLQNNF